MSIFKATLLAGLCLASFACHDTPPGSRGGSDSAKRVDGTGHTGDLSSGSDTQRNPDSTGSAANAPSGATTPSGTGNSNTDMPRR